MIKWGGNQFHGATWQFYRAKTGGQLFISTFSTVWFMSQCIMGHIRPLKFFFFYSLQSENKKLGLCLLWLISIQLTLDNGSTQQTLRLHKQPLHRLKKHKGHVTATSERDSIPEGASIESLLNQNQERKWIHEARWPHFQWPCLALKTSFIGRDNFQAEGHRVLR